MTYLKTYITQNADLVQFTFNNPNHGGRWFGQAVSQSGQYIYFFARTYSQNGYTGWFQRSDNSIHDLAKMPTRAEVDSLNTYCVKNKDNADAFSLQKTTDGRLAVYVNDSWVGTIVYDSKP